MHSFLSLLFALAAVLSCAAAAFGCMLPEQLEMMQAQLNATNTTLDKRWFTVQGDNEAPKPIRWPNSEVVFCWRNKDSQNALELLIPAAWNIWRAAGVDSRLKFHQGTDSVCRQAKKTGSKTRKDILIIGSNNKGSLVSSVGKVSVSDPDFENGPRMELDPNPNIALGNAASNIAHEIGHVWGFFHEHQRPDLWDTAMYNGATGRRNQFKYRCENLREFEDWYTMRQNSDENLYNQPLTLDVERACTNYGAAIILKFNASAEMLPMIASIRGAKFGGPEGSGQDPDIDWESIMLYPTHLGAKTLEDGTKAKVLTRANGEDIAPNLVPSANDVAQMMTMYPQDGPDSAPCFLWQECYPNAGLFKTRRMKTLESCQS